MNLKKDRRKTKRILNYRMKKGGYGKFVLDCRGVPCVVTSVERYTDDPYGCGCEVKSLIDGTPNSCSYLHCGITPISKADADEMVRHPTRWK
jgi:hypothetical protein